MNRFKKLRISNPPPKPLLIWDGDCEFCRFWIERWRQMTAGTVDYITYQEAGNRFSEIPPEEFNRSLVLIQPNGTVVFAAEAAYRSLASPHSREWLAWSYDHVPGFAAVSEIGYGLIARHRKFASAITRLLWGKDVRRPTYLWARRWFLRALGVIYLIA
ncbi:MAG TPA: DCC1-like thiol-disulfide oxidoreductase family protein, partial [Candidatus Udaeobacter sp.]|nr:DCC1-like thiol-disulfide oxidoreductase family protein [Candidatus Udaeobacter sp.]